MTKLSASFKDKHIIFYDGDCGFCNFWVQWILKRDHKNHFLFAALQSTLGQQFLRERHLETENFDSIYLWKPHSYYLKKSDAAIKIGQLLGGIYQASVAGRILPLWIRDGIYEAIAKRRKNLMTQQCLIPTAEERKKFID